MVGCWPRPQQLKRPGGRLPSTAGVDGLPKLLNLPSTAITHATGAPVMAHKHAVVHDIHLLKGVLAAAHAQAGGSSPLVAQHGRYPSLLLGLCHAKKRG